MLKIKITLLPFHFLLVKQNDIVSIDQTRHRSSLAITGIMSNQSSSGGYQSLT